MTDTPSDPNESNPTARFDPPEPAAPIIPPLAAPPPPPIAPAEPQEPPPTPQAPPPSRAWPPPSWRSGGDDPGRIGTIVFGAILLVIGLWFFADQTLGLEMPRLRWSQLWPIFLIGFGAWIAIGSMRRR